MKGWKVYNIVNPRWENLVNDWYQYDEEGYSHLSITEEGGTIPLARRLT